MSIGPSATGMRHRDFSERLLAPTHNIYFSATLHSPSSQLQLAYRAALGDDGPVPQSMAKALTWLDAGVRGEHRHA
jgi:hypothetical protein